MTKYHPLNRNTFFDDQSQQLPVKSIEIMNDGSFKISCENEQNASIFQNTTHIIASYNSSNKKRLNYSLERDEVITTVFYLSGKDASKIFPIFVSVGLLSKPLWEELQKEIIDHFTQKWNQQGGCTIC